MRIIIISFLLLSLMIGGCQTVDKQIDIAAEKAIIEKVIKNNIAWAVTKDTTLLYSTVAQDEDLFYFSPSDNGTISGFEAFKQLTEGFFMHPDFKGVDSNTREMVIHISQSGDAAWWHCRLDDFNEWKGQPANWEDYRWSGVLEKREGKWVIVQMHFSRATDKAE